MRLYLSSYGLGNKPEAMLPLIKGARRTAIIMNAQDLVLPERRADRLNQEIDGLKNLGLQPQELDLRKFFDKPNELKETIKDFDFVWVRGGNVFLLRRAFKQSGFDKILVDMLNNDAIAYGGFSAGVCILVPSLRGIELVDPKDEVADGYDKDVIWDGLGILPYAVAPHYKSNHPESADIDKCVDYFKANQIPFKTLSDGETILINGIEEILIK